MVNTLYRLRNCFSVSSISTLLVGAGNIMIGVFAPIALSYISQDEAKLFTVIGLVLVGVGIVLFAYRYITNPVEKRLRVYSIVSTLDRLFKTLDTLAVSQSRETIDRIFHLNVIYN